ARERCRRVRHPRGGGAGADGPFDADGGGLAEANLQAEVVGQRRADDLLLDFAVELHRELLAQVVLAQVDQRVLLGQLGEGRVQGALVAGSGGDDHGLQGRWGEMMLGPGGPWEAELVADPDLVESPELADLAGGDRGAGHGRAPG